MALASPLPTLPSTVSRDVASLGSSTTRRKMMRCHTLLDPCQPSSKRQRTSSAPSKTKEGMRKTVSFNEERKHRIVVQNTDEDKKNAWYNRTEYRRIREDIQATALSVQLGISDFIEPEDFCVRGLEANLSPDAAVLRRLRRRLLVESILKEQSAQRTLGAVNHEVIRELSRVLSTDSQIDAVQRGVSDSHVSLLNALSR